MPEVGGGPVPGVIRAGELAPPLICCSIQESGTLCHASDTSRAEGVPVGNLPQGSRETGELLTPPPITLKRELVKTKQVKSSWWCALGIAGRLTNPATT